jgi:hypothetical protein
MLCLCAWLRIRTCLRGTIGHQNGALAVVATCLLWPAVAFFALAPIHSYGSRHLQAQLSHSLIHAVITARLAESKTPTQFRYNDGPQGFRGKPGTSTSWPAALTVSTAWDVNLSNAWGVSLTDASKSCSA